MSKRLFALFPLSFALLLAPDYASAAERNAGPEVLEACYAEAQWPVTASSAYVYGNGRQREQLTNGSNREAYAMRRLCYRLAARASDTTALSNQCAGLVADTLKRHGDEAVAHARRQKALCEQLGGRPIAVDGL
jgi:hypothetical protein